MIVESTTLLELLFLSVLHSFFYEIVDMTYLIYDGACGFCNKIVLFVAKNDAYNHLIFVSSLSVFGADLLQKYRITGLENTTIILLENDKVFVRAMAVQRILKKLPKYKLLGFMMHFLPNKLIDCIYNFIAKYRKKIIKNNNCEIPDIKIRKKFIV